MVNALPVLPILNGTAAIATATVIPQLGASVVPSVCLTVVLEVAAANLATCWLTEFVLPIDFDDTYFIATLHSISYIKS